jgi:hypothetical protein
MPQPHFTLTISASAVAWYAAVVTTASSIIQVANFFRDRPHMKLKVLKNHKILGDPRHPDTITHTIVTATNAGRRPLTITSTGLLQLNDVGFLFLDTLPHLPAELTEGKIIYSYLDQADLDFDQIGYFYARDTTGREFRLNCAPWYRRAFWRLRRSHRRPKR